MSPLIVSVIEALFSVIVALIRAGNDRAAQEEALMVAAEVTKRTLDAIKFKAAP